jgi:pimeloyl-ACP methyl ester carboxylesterase
MPLVHEDDERARPAIANRMHRPLFIQRAGGRIAYYEHGTGSTTLAFIHPFVYGLSVFQPLIEELCQEFRIITIDPRGTGASDPLTSGYDMHDHTDDVREVLVEAGRGRPVVAVGISRGVLLLVRLAVLYPELLDRIVLVGGYWRQTVGLGAAAPLEAGELRRTVEDFAPTIYSEPGTEELRKQFIDQCLNLNEATVRRFFSFDPKNDVSDLLGRVRLPTLLAHGGEDRDVPIAAAREMASRIPGSTLYCFEGKGHLPTFTATAEFCDVLRRFVRGEGLGPLTPP